ncbi:hypothetical protein JTB14_026190 [Gonioctena quinquepunctata]|nr:hypothetical protein JTB14_026190 [Gonioctena quinquepunctata]
MLLKIFDCSKFKYRIFQYLAAIGANLGMISIGMHYGWGSSALPILTSGNHTFQITSTEGSWLISTLPLSAILGDCLALLLQDKIGHNTMITLTSIPLFVSWILLGLAPSKTYMFLGKFIAGLADGVLFTALPPYLSEISEPEIRGFMGASFMVSIVLGMLLINIIFLFASMASTAYIASIVSLLMLPILSFLPESPYFYLMKKDILSAKASLQKFQGKGEVVEELYRISKGIMEEGVDKISAADLFSNKYHRKSLLLSLLAISTMNFSGAFAIQSYSEEVFEKSRYFLEPKISIIIYYVVFFVVVVFSQLMLDHIGRRPLMLISTGMVSLMLFLNGTFLYIQTSTDIDTSGFDFIQLPVILVYIISHAFGLYSIPVVFSSEIFSANVKTLGLFFVNVTYSISLTAMVKFFEWSDVSFGIFVPFYGFGSICAVAFVLLLIFFPETKLKTLEEIQADNRRGKSNYNLNSEIGIHVNKAIQK